MLSCLQLQCSEIRPLPYSGSYLSTCFSKLYLSAYLTNVPQKYTTTKQNQTGNLFTQSQRFEVYFPAVAPPWLLPAAELAPTATVAGESLGATAGVIRYPLVR